MMKVGWASRPSSTATTAVLPGENYAMSEQDNNQDAGEVYDFSEAEQYEAQGGDAIDAAEQSAQSQEQGVLSRLQSERDDLESRLLRVSADYQNFARRAQQNVDSAVEQKLMDIARGLVTVMDHFDRALDVESEGESAGVLKGVTMVHHELLATLNRFGIQRLDVQPGEEFDPVKHEALMRQPTHEIASNHITMQMQPGYVLGEKVIRPAQVGVAE